MTEEEAKTKWCPFSNVNIPYQNTGAGGNRGQFSDVGQFQERYTRCLGSGCMAWRWNYTRKTVPKDLAEAEEAKGFKVIGYEATAFDVTYKMAKRLDNGRCGLAGKP